MENKNKLLVVLEEEVLQLPQIFLNLLNSRHRSQFEKCGRMCAVTRYGCYLCVRIYSVGELPIHEWVDGGQTALCPHCGIDAVIPEVFGLVLSEQFLQKLHDVQFAVERAEVCDEH